MDQGWDLFTKFDVNDHFVRAGFRKGFEQDVWLGTHQVNVKEKFGEWADGLDNLRTEGNVRDEWPSMISRCSRSAPERSARSASCPKQDWLEARSEGAIIISATFDFIFLLAYS